MNCFSHSFFLGQLPAQRANIVLVNEMIYLTELSDQILTVTILNQIQSHHSLMRSN
jgi:hypothetical protein